MKILKISRFLVIHTQSKIHAPGKGHDAPEKSEHKKLIRKKTTEQVPKHLCHFDFSNRTFLKVESGIDVCTGIQTCRYKVISRLIELISYVRFVMNNRLLFVTLVVVDMLTKSNIF